MAQVSGRLENLPRYVVIIVDTVNDVIVQFVESLQQVELLLDLVQLRLLRVGKAEQVLTDGV